MDWRIDAQVGGRLGHVAEAAFTIKRAARNDGQIDERIEYTDKRQSDNPEGNELLIKRHVSKTHRLHSSQARVV
ncbi:hypothetical protein NXT3_PC01245 (plasmid) [Sinorhizobium fredii]|uniref:Uncharacterized protein n=1 Tax=Rhizobium fredii TaxID=380 RepID=A0A2L0HHB8_RHIFR|nr:hypothetical protein NXT3_PC01245 [Sinorhizobium fredii]